MQSDRPTIRPNEAAEFLDVSVDTVLRAFADGLIEGYRKTPRRKGWVYLYRDSVEEFDRQRKSQAPPIKQ